MEFKLAIGDPTSKRTYKAEIKDADAEKLVGKKLSDKFKGELLGLAGYELEITGGSDNAGFPMRKDIIGPIRKKAILTSGIGFNSKRKGLRQRKSVRGNVISIDTAQINCKVTKAGSKKLADVFGAPKEEKEEVKEEPKAKEKVEEKPKEVKEEAKPKEKKEEKAPKEEIKEEKPKEEKSKKEAKPEVKEEKPVEEAPKEEVKKEAKEKKK